MKQLTGRIAPAEGRSTQAVRWEPRRDGWNYANWKNK